jgi:hypothetical protein
MHASSHLGGVACLQLVESLNVRNGANFAVSIVGRHERRHSQPWVSKLLVLLLPS